jgi:hypothetical protein
VTQKIVNAMGHKYTPIRSASNLSFQYDICTCCSCGNTIAVITKYIGAEGTVEIPAGLEGYPVVEIGERAFTWNFNAANVVIPESVITISDFAFMYTPSLVFVHIGDNVEAIGDQAFFGCPLLETVVFGDGVKTIGAQAFAECKSLKKITVPSKVVSIGDKAFYQCSALYSVVISDSVVSMGKHIFQECTSLVTVTLGESVESIPYGAFDGCSSLTNINLPESITKIDEFAFWGCSSLQKIVIPNSVKLIDKCAFEECTQLRECILGNQVETIGVSAFFNCASLADVVLPTSVAVLGRNAFYGCFSLKAITYQGTVADFYSLKLRTVIGWNFENIPIEEGEGLGICHIKCADGETVLHCKYTVLKSNELFAYMYSSVGCDCGVLEDAAHNEVTILNYIGADTEIELPSYIDGYPVTLVSNSLLSDSVAKVTKVKFPEGITQLFGVPGCTTVTTVEIPASVTIICSGAFRDCTNLATILFASNSKLTTIAHEAFIGCASLKNIEIPNGVATIEGNAS